LDASLNLGVLPHDSIKQDQTFKQFLKHFSRLEKLRICLGSWYKKGGLIPDWELTPKGCDLLIEAVEEVKDTLNVLEIYFLEAADAKKMDGVAKMVVTATHKFPK
jgi:hypothetical protein